MSPLPLVPGVLFNLNGDAGWGLITNVDPQPVVSLTLEPRSGAL